MKEHDYIHAATDRYLVIILCCDVRIGGRKSTIDKDFLNLYLRGNA
jgi:hypothetical protein